MKYLKKKDYDDLWYQIFREVDVKIHNYISCIYYEYLCEINFYDIVK